MQFQTIWPKMMLIYEEYAIDAIPVFTCSVNFIMFALREVRCV